MTTDKYKEFTEILLAASKERVAECGGEERDEEILELAERLEIGNVKRVEYSIAEHGDCLDAEDGDLVWFWGKDSRQLEFQF